MWSPGTRARLGMLVAQRILLVLSESADMVRRYSLPGRRADAACRSAFSSRARARLRLYSSRSRRGGGGGRGGARLVVTREGMSDALASHACLQLLGAPCPSEMVADALRRVSVRLVCAFGGKCGEGGGACGSFVGRRLGEERGGLCMRAGHCAACSRCG
ncbi:hypothetical protein DFH09DRAFT_126209 [Mycena vulgaris]|nr:hypothetical protein DFH09DRAFT_126209 [Mycena vulgaris]